MQKFLADLDAYKADQESNLRQAQYSTNVYQAQIEGWKAKTSASVADAEMQLRFADMNTRTNIAYSEMQIFRVHGKDAESNSTSSDRIRSCKSSGAIHGPACCGRDVGRACFGQHQRVRFGQFI